MREALKRASVEEKQQYSGILQRKKEIFLRMQEIDVRHIALNEKDKLNVLPPPPASSRLPDNGSVKTLQRQRLNACKEAADYDARRKRYTDALKDYNNLNAGIIEIRIKLTQEFSALKAELAMLEETEKWLLLAMAIRNQSSLLGFM